MEKHLLITSLRQSVKKINLPLDDISIYLFGSFGKSPSASDIDLLLIYDEKKISVSKILEIRKKLYANHKNISHLPLDISILNISEEREVNFIFHEKAIQLL
ncbi:nucleotidyltransferase domain-containing protein [Lysinibacillus capsici]|uniref:nucleotidyltransferase domain-containing protein n=1 Tax=Lysinibacillus capsici TaxID=2115968 RepID=UPI001CD9902C